MKLGKTLQEMAAEIERQQTAKKDMLVSTPAITFADRALEIDGSRYELTPHAAGQIADRVGIPRKYYDKMAAEAPELLTNNVQHWFDNKPEARLVRTLDGKARAFLSDSFKRIDNYDVLNTILPILGEVPGLKVLSTEITETRMYIKAVSTKIVAEVKGSKRVGDFVEAGIIISNSEIGMGAINISPFFHFLACTNGMVRNKEGMRGYHVGAKNKLEEDHYKILSQEALIADDHAILLKVRDFTTASMDQLRLQKAVDTLSMTTQQKITGNIDKVMEKTVELLGASQPEKDSILRHLIEGGDLSRFGLINAVTRTAEDLESYDRATEFEAAGGQILDLSPSQWSTIANAA